MSKPVQREPITPRSDEEALAESLVLTPIGVIRTPFHDRNRTPRQGAADLAATEAVIELVSGLNLEQAVQDLEGFEKIWILSWFHRNRTWKPKVLPPRGPRQKRGVLATRSPHRPNPIGLSVADLVSIDGRRIRVRGIDLLDGTPILDIKPYLPYADAFPDARCGWVEEAFGHRGSARGLNAPARFSVSFSPLAAEQAGFLKTRFGIDVLTATLTVLQVDPQPHPYRRVRKVGANHFELSVKSWRAIFAVADASVLVERIASGYAAARLTAEEKLHDAEAHVAFHQRWPV